MEKCLKKIDYPYCDDSSCDYFYKGCCLSKEKQSEYFSERFMTPFRFKYGKHCQEHPKGASLTRPDDSLSIYDLYSKYRRGLDVGDIYLEGHFDGDENVDLENDFDETRQGDFDMVDAHIGLQELQQKKAREQGSPPKDNDLAKDVEPAKPPKHEKAEPSDTSERKE